MPSGGSAESSALVRTMIQWFASQFFAGKVNVPLKVAPACQRDRVPAIRAVKSRLQISSSSYGDRGARRGCVRHRGLNVNAGKFCGAVEGSVCCTGRNDQIESRSCSVSGRVGDLCGERKRTAGGSRAGYGATGALQLNSGRQRSARHAPCIRRNAATRW